MKRSGLGLAACVFVLAACATAMPNEVPTALPNEVWKDNFADLTPWTAHPASDVAMELTAGVGRDDASALRVEFGFVGGGWAIARRDVDLELPENYVFSFWVRGESGPQTLEFKLVDASGENVWWSVRRDFVFTDAWQRVAIKKRQIEFAWGPQGGGELRGVASIEIAITASSGGVGTVWIDELRLDRLPLPSAVPPAPLAHASSTAASTSPQAACDGNSETVWAPARGDAAPQLVFDLVDRREFGGVELTWAPDRHAADYALEVSDDGEQWRTLIAVRSSNGGSDLLHTPEAEARWLRLRIPTSTGNAPALAELELRPVTWAPRREDVFAELASRAPRGSYPRAYVGEQSYWTVVGVDGDPAELLFSEDGAIEVGPWQPSLEPFVEIEGRVFTWADVERACRLEDDDLPLPKVQWSSESFTLEIAATPIGEPGRSSVAVRYRITNRGTQARDVVLHLAVRPFQVNPPVQFLNRPGGLAPIHRLRADARGFEIEGRRAVILLDPPARTGVAGFFAGDVVAEHLVRGALPQAMEVDDAFGAASGLATYPSPLEAGASTEVMVLIPLAADAPSPPLERQAAALWWNEQVQTSRARWRADLDRVELDLPASAQWIEDTLRSQLAYILVNRDGAAIQPGSRSYARSWIRDGALTSSALLRLGHAEVARDFLEWFAPHQFADGKIPCVVDDRGGDPVPEHDSGGEFIFLVAELLRYTDDLGLAARMWPRVEAAANYLDELRALRRTDAYRSGEQALFFGLFPESISHEGYSAKPMHSYWDDFWGVRGFADAAWIAQRLGRDAQARHWRAVHAEFSADVARSVRRAQEVHDIDYVPGCADLGDFDATSTTIAFAPTNAAEWLDPAALEATFERYWEFFDARRNGAPWDAYTPYELRNVGAFVHLGWRERAHAALEWFRRYQRPDGWNHWAEVVVSEEREPRFLGDMPHTWVGSDFVRAVLDLFVYVTGARDDEVVLGAGLLPEWIEAEGGVRVSKLPTPFGRIDFSVQANGEAWQARVSGDLEPPGAGLWLRLPLDRVPRSVQIDGVEVGPPTERGVRIEQLPATVTVLR